MGNGSSQSIVLGPPRPHGIPLRGGPNYQRGFPKYADPHNRVLPNPVAGQRLRCTDNGNFLHNVGTIRGQRLGSGFNDDHEDGDPEMMEILRKRSEHIDKEQDCYHQINLRNHRLFHSDPDIARTRPTSTSQESLDPGGQRKSGGGAAMRASKLRYRKKARAPEPPSASSLPRQFERRPQPGSLGMGHVHQQKNAVCRCVNNGPDWRPKNRAPPPPLVGINHPPPPPPLPQSGGRTIIGQSQAMSVTKTTQGKVTGPVVTRVIDSNLSRIQNYEKNIHPLSKWRNSRSVGDIRSEEEDQRPGSRTTVFDSRAHLVEGQSKKALLPALGPDPFQKEIEAVVKKIAETRQQNETKNFSASTVPDNAPISPGNPSPKQYYFSDPEAFKMPCSSKSTSCYPEDEKNTRVNDTLAENNDIRNQRNLCDVDVVVHASKEDAIQGLPSNYPVLRDENIPPLYDLQGYRDPSTSVSPYKINPSMHEMPPDSTPSQEKVKHNDWDELHNVMLQKHDNESDIDIKLRPVLPRKTFPVSKFSPMDAWQALGSDGGVGSSNHSTSEGDDGSELIRQNNKPDAWRWNAEKGTRNLAQLVGNKRVSTRTVTSDAYHWTPRQDLAEDSDTSSIHSEDAVLPKNHGHAVGEFPQRFSLPTVMFSNMRPIGTELPSNKIITRSNRLGKNLLEESPLSRQRESHGKKNLMNTGNSPVDASTVTNIKKFLGIKNKYLSEEDVSASDSNWTFGKHALQKNGKHYSSDIMLAKDKKNYELIVQNNFSDLLGDILVSKASDLKQKMRASDSDHSNFSFYSTEGHVVRSPHSEYNVEEVPSPPTKGRVYHTRRKPDYREVQQQVRSQVRSKKKVDVTEREIERKRGQELVRILEEEVRRRRNKEKISIRQQLQMLKRLNSDDDDDEEDFDDEAYFTEPKSLEGTPSPQYLPPTSRLQDHRLQTEIPLSNWKSCPALLEDPLQKCSRRLKEEPSSSSITSSPESTNNKNRIRTIVTDSRILQNGDRSKKKAAERQTSGVERSSSDHIRYSSFNRPNQQLSPENIRKKLGPVHHRKEKGVSSVYKQLMDIVRREERHLKKEKGEEEVVSRDSSYSQRESSLSTTSSPESETTTSSSSSCSGSANRQTVGDRSSARSGIPANNEFHHASLDTDRPSDAMRNAPVSQGSDPRGKSVFQLALVQPFSPNKIYRPVPFDMIVPAANSACKRVGLKDEGQRATAQAS